MKNSIMWKGCLDSLLVPECVWGFYFFLELLNALLCCCVTILKTQAHPSTSRESKLVKRKVKKTKTKWKKRNVTMISPKSSCYKHIELQILFLFFLPSTTCFYMCWIIIESRWTLKEALRGHCISGVLMVRFEVLKS